jgi:hypothetical protein
MAGTPAPITDLGTLLSGSMGEMNLTKLTRILEDEAGNVKRKMGQGLSNEEYVKAAKRAFAILSAQAVLKSIQMYQTN